MDLNLQHPAFAELIAALRLDDAPLHIVGGAVRDHLLRRPTVMRDLDVVVEHSALAIGRRAADSLGWAFYPLDSARDVARLVYGASTPAPLVCDIAAMRGPTIERDLASRDFTINAMAVSYLPGAEPRLVDCTGGLDDLRYGIVRRVTAHSLIDDSIRILRGVRHAVELDFRFDTTTEDQCRRLASTVLGQSPERIRDELWKMLGAPDPVRAIVLLRELDLLAHVLPELSATIGVEQGPPHALGVYSHTVETVRHMRALSHWVMTGDPSALGAAGQDLVAALGSSRTRLYEHLSQPTADGRTRADWLTWHALLHDVGKPVTQTTTNDPAVPTGDAPVRIRFFGHEEIGARLAAQRVEALRFARSEIALVSTVCGAHMRPLHLHASFAGQTVSRRALYRFFRDVDGRQFIPSAGIDTCLLALADFQATYGIAPPPGWRDFLEHISEMLDFGLGRGELAPLVPLVDGHDLLRLLDIEPGPRLGLLLEHLREAQVAGEIVTSDDALREAAGWLNRQDA